LAALAESRSTARSNSDIGILKGGLGDTSSKDSESIRIVHQLFEIAKKAFIIFASSQF